MSPNHLGLRATVAAALVSSACAVNAGAALVITQNADTAAGFAAFGPAVPAFDWASVFAPGTVWPFGSLGPSVNGPSGFPLPSGASVLAASGSGLNVANWIDGNGAAAAGFGFNAADGSAAPDLALNGAESFSLTFASPLYAVGFTVATGLSNLPAEVNHAGAVFQISTDSGGAATLTLADNGAGHSAWVTITSDTPFSTLTFTEPSGDIYDQYFGNVFAPVPEPGTGALWLVGLLGLVASQASSSIAASSSRALRQWRRTVRVVTPSAEPISASL